MKRQLLLLLLLLTTWGAQAQRTNIQVESFEVPVGSASSNVDAANTTIYTFTANVPGTTATTTKDEYFQRWVSSADPSGFSRPVASGNTGTFDGTYYWAGEGVRGPAGTSSIVRAPGLVTLKPASIVGKGSLQLTVSFYDGEVAQGRTPWETNDVFTIQANIDNTGWNTIGQFVGNTTTKYMRQDTNLDGSSDDAADASSREWTSVPADYTFAIAGSGSSIQVRIVANQQGSTEEFAFDNIRLSGVGSTNAAPTLTAIETTPLAFTEGGANAQITNALLVNDADNTTLAGGTVQFTAGFDNTEDRLVFASQGGITGSYNTGTGVLTLMGTAPLATYEAALRSVQYQNIDAIDASPATRTVAFTVTDTGSPAATSLTATRQITVTTHLDAASGLPYTESFDTDGEGARYGSNHFFVQDGIQFLRTSDNPHNVTGGPTTFLAASGAAYASPYWFGENTTSSANPATVKNGTLTTKQLDATGYVNLQFSILLGASNVNQGAASSATTTWTTSDYFKLYYRVGGSSGSWVVFDSYRGTGAAGSSTYNVLKRDIDPNAAPGSAAPTGATLTPTLTAYTTALPAALNGQFVEFQAVLVNASSNNDFAFDQIQVTGTPLMAPTVTTAAASGTTTTSAMLGGQVTSDGGATVTDRGVVYSASSTVPTTSDTKVPMGMSTGIYSQAVTGLTAGTSYYVRAYAINSVGTSYGAVVMFTTLPNAPVLTSPANYSSLATTTPTYAGTAPAGSTVTVYVDGGRIGTITAVGGTFSLTQPTTLTSGPHTVYATATVGGSTSTSSTTTSFTVDTTPPTATLSTTASSPTSTSPIPFAVSFSEAVTGFSASGISVTNGSVTSGSVSGSGPYTFTVTPFNNGAVTVSIRANAAQDAAGNASVASAAVSVTYSTYTVWTGNTSTDWFTASNWTGGVPTTTLDVTIPSAPSGNRFPFLSAGAAQARNLSISSNAALVMRGGTLDVRASLTNNGTLQPTGGTIVLGTSSLSNIFGNGTVRFWNLTTGTGGALLATSAGASVQRVLTLNGNFATNGNLFTLESNASGTALVVNSGGVVTGTATVQRYIDPSLNAGLGYRHYSAPVSNSSVADLTTNGFTPVVNPAYNTSATPTAEQPFPTVYGYDEQRVNLNNNLASFDKGYFSPASLSAPLAVGRGYTVNIGGSQLVDFQGSLNNGDITLNLTSARASNAAGGWQLLGNPYPAPLDYALVDPADRAGLEGAIYVYSSTSQYGGQYRAYINGMGNSVLPMGQAFFARVATDNSGATLTFRNSQRLTAAGTTTFQRTAADARPLVQLTLQGAGSSLTDEATVYFEAGATAGFDAGFDAAKLPNPSGLNLAAQAAGQDLAINGLPVLGQGEVRVPLSVRVPAAGTYSLTATQLLNLLNTPVYLHDLQMGTLTDLRQQAQYSFSLTTASPASRFELVFSPQQALATVPAALATQVAAYPNPMHAPSTLTLELPLSLSRQPVTATLVDALGRVVYTQELPGGRSTHALALPDLATGVYALRLTTELGTMVKKLVID